MLQEDSSVDSKPSHTPGPVPMSGSNDLKGNAGRMNSMRQGCHIHDPGTLSALSLPLTKLSTSFIVKCLSSQWFHQCPRTLSQRVGDRRAWVYCTGSVTHSKGKEGFSFL